MTSGARRSPPKRDTRTGPPPPVFRVFCTLVHIRAHHTRSTVRLRRTVSRPSPPSGQPPPSVCFCRRPSKSKIIVFTFPPIRLSGAVQADFFARDITILIILFVRPSSLRLHAVDFVRQARRTFPNRIDAVPVDMSGPTLKRLSAPPLSVLLSVTLLLQVTVTVVSGQEEDVSKPDLDNAILEVFPTPPTPSPPSDRCICVPYYLCRNKTINTDGEGLIDIRFKEGPCPNYLDVCCYDPMKSSETTNISYDEKRTKCGQWNSEGVGFRITGHSNNEAQFGEFPWMMAILKLEANQSKTYLCGGSLIHPQVVLTAVHCVHNKDPNDLVIRAGEWDSQTENELLPLQDGEVLKIIKHEKYYGGALFNDVALVIVTKPFLLRENVGTLCLPKPNYVFDRERCYASGWGKNVFDAVISAKNVYARFRGEIGTPNIINQSTYGGLMNCKSGVYQVILKRIDLPIVPRSSCLALLRKTRLGMNYKLHESFICAGGEIGKDTCQGDGGSPLMCPLENRPQQFHQAGIVAWGIGCGDETPGVYVDVAMFRNWIDEQMFKENFDTSFYDPDYVPQN